MPSRAARPIPALLLLGLAHTANAAGRVARYRQILVRMMESEGFTN
jgi:hypothetical protein